MALSMASETEHLQGIAQAQEQILLARHSVRQLLAALASEDEPALTAKKVSNLPWRWLQHATVSCTAEIRPLKAGCACR
jgi:hypothetical protein